MLVRHVKFSVVVLLAIAAIVGVVVAQADQTVKVELGLEHDLIFVCYDGQIGQIVVDPVSSHDLVIDCNEATNAEPQAPPPDGNTSRFTWVYLRPGQSALARCTPEPRPIRYDAGYHSVRVWCYRPLENATDYQHLPFVVGSEVQGAPALVQTE